MLSSCHFPINEPGLFDVQESNKITSKRTDLSKIIYSFLVRCSLETLPQVALNGKRLSAVPEFTVRLPKPLLIDVAIMEGKS